MDARDDVGPRRRRRVLIIDDDSLILAALERQLAASHDVVTVADPSDALDLLQAGAIFDAVLCDLWMPSMTGVQFHAELERQAPRLAHRTVLMTGGSARREASALLDASRIPTLAKPFDVDTLRRMIDTLTAG